MDPERQPLLGDSDARCRRLSPLTSEEVLTTQQHASWRATRFCLVFVFWAIMAAVLSLITCILVNSSGCSTHDRSRTQAPSVPPVHMTFAPLIAKMNNDRAFTL